MSKVLVVEDDKTLREVYATILRFSDYEVDTASNGRSALQLCQKNHYDVVLLDLMMPILDGVGFLKEAGLHEKAPKTKILVFSNLSTGSLLEEALRLGVNEHVLKSHLTPRGLVELVRQYTTPK